MPPSISGHGGEFELLKNNSDLLAPAVPTLDFTLPLGTVEVQIDHTALQPPNPPPRDPDFDNRPGGAPANIKHPNDHPTHRLPLTLTGVGPYQEAYNLFRIVPRTEGDMAFVVRYYPQTAPDQTIQIPPNSAFPAVKFDFQGEAGFYLAVVVYNFRAWRPPNDPNYGKILLETDTGLKDEADRPCYIYVAAAQDADDFRNPQSPNHQRKSWPGASLAINVKELGVLMGATSTLYDGNGEILYHAGAEQIDKSNLNFDQRVIPFDRITDQDSNMANGVTYSVNDAKLAAVGIPAFPLGLYIVAKPAIGSPAAGTQAAPQNPENGSAKVNINTASLDALVSLPGIGAVLAERIDIERRKLPFSSIQDLQRVNGIGSVLLEQLGDRITV
jgi:competence protein ComEA